MSERYEAYGQISDDIAMPDERTQGEAINEPLPVRKVVYGYERYYD